MATLCRIEAVNDRIAKYPRRFPIPKYLLFIKAMIDAGWTVRIYRAGISRYIFVVKGDRIYKVRFSNHKPLYNREMEGDCDFYVGISHTQVSTTEEVIKQIIK